MPTNTARAWRREFHELAFRTVFELAGAAGEYGQWIAYRLYFGWLFRRADPWRYASSAYELEKYQRTLGTLRGLHATRVLEAGCAEGAFTELFMRHAAGCEILGVDVSEAALVRARQRCRAYPGAHFARANLAFQAPDGPFDLIICAEVLYYMGARSVNACAILTDRLAPHARLVAVHPADRADALHAPWYADPRLVFEQRVRGESEGRPYVIDLFSRVG